MIEKIVYDYLKANLTGADVYTLRPDDQAGEFVVIDRTGGSESDHVVTVTIAVQSFADSLLKACELNEDVKDLMKNITSLSTISQCKLSRDYNFTDTNKKKYRYQAIFEIVYI